MRSLVAASSAGLCALLTLSVLAPTARAQQAPGAVINKLTLDFGFVQTSGNTQVTTTSLGERFTQERGRFTLSQAFALVYGEQRDTVNANNLRTTLRGDYKIDQVFAWFVGGGFDRNVFAGIARRFEEQVGLQAQVFAAVRDTIRLEGGGSLTQQIAVGGRQTNFPSARSAISWRHAFTSSSYFNQNLEYAPNLSELTDWRVNSESAIVAPLSARIGFKLSYVVRYDNLPEPGFSTTDRLFTTGIQLTY